MIIGEQGIEREPVIYDSSIGNELQDAVAMDCGIRDGGELDMDVLAAVEQVAEHSKLRHNHPFILADVTHDTGTGSTHSVIGLLGVFANQAKLVGVHEGRWTRPGIAVSSVTNLGISFDARGVVVLDRYGIEDTQIQPLSVNNLVLGRPQLSASAPEGSQVRQEFVVGHEIVPWIVETLDDSRNGYTMYRMVLASVIGSAAFLDMHIDTLLAEPFIQKALEHEQALETTKLALRSYERRVTAAQKVVEGIRGSADLALDDIRTQYPEFRDQTLFEVTASVSEPGAKSVTNRIAAIDRAEAPIAKAVLRARQTGLL